MFNAASRYLMVFGAFEFDPVAGLLYKGEVETLLPLRAAKVLEVFLSRPGEVLSKHELLGEVWKDAFVGEDSLTQAISMVRNALGDDPRDPTYIQTIPKRGYRFIAEVSTKPGVEQDGAVEPEEAIRRETIGEETPPAEPVIGVGSSLGHYEILAELGAGSMGVVYLARDTVLEREVAIKVLPEAFIADAERVARFEREAKLLAAVSHPNIAAIHSLEEANGIKFPVLELVEGETLDQRLRSGRIKVEEALELARQTASALEAAHQRGIIHRDLKPANIKITPEGQVKVLDFGLAKALEVKVFGADAAESPTESMTIIGSRRGSIVGTAAYMSPEQARGQEAGKRADIWSFGCVLYEMLAGTRAFGGETVSDTIAGLLEREPDWEALPDETPRAALRVLRRCLSKDPQHRLHDIADARIELEEAIEEPEEGLPGLAAAPAADRWTRVAVAAIGLLAGVGLTVLVSWALSGTITAPATAPTAVRVELVLPPETSLPRRSANLQLAVSPSGEQIVFRARRNGVWGLYRRPLDEHQAALMPGTEGGHTPFFSPDGEWIGFFANRKLWKVRLDGGLPQELCDAVNPWGATWGPDGTIVFTPEEHQGLWKVSEAGGTPERIALPDLSKGEFDYNYPTFLPDGKSLLVGIYFGGHGTFQLGVMDMETGEIRGLIERAAHGVYIPTGHILFGRADGVYAVGFDPETKTLISPEVPVLRNVAFDVGSRVAQFGVSEAGVVVYTPGTGLPKRELVRVGLDGQATPLLVEPRAYMYPRYSPDGTKVAVNIIEGENDIWIVDVETGTLRRLTSGGNNEDPIWTPDGQRVTFHSDRSNAGRWDIYWQAADGSSSAELLFAPFDEGDGSSFWPSQWSPDASSLLGSGSTEPRDFREGVFGILYLTIGESPGLRALVAASPGTAKYGAAFSLDGKWVAYVSNETTRQEIYVTPFPGPGERRMISTGGGNKPRWSPDGQRLYYRYRSSGRIMVVDVVTEPEFRASPPRVLFEAADYLTGLFYLWPNFDLAPDGESFVMIRDAEEQAPPTHLNIILNWFEELKERVPTGR